MRSHPGPRLLLCTCLVFLINAALPAAPPGRFALLVGVRKYPAERFVDLPGAERDVAELAKVLRGNGYKKENVVVLTNSQGGEDPRFFPFAANIRRELKLLLENRREDDVVLIALAGHGVQPRNKPYFFCPYDADLKKNANLISVDEIYRLLGSCPARFKVLLVDACRKESLAPPARSSTPPARLPVSLTMPRLPDPPGGIAAFYSCSKGQYAYERKDDDVSHGVFFRAVIEAMQGGAADDRGQVTLPDLEKYVKRHVEEFVRAKYGASQIPELHNRTRGLTPLVRVRAKAVTNTIGMKLAYIPAGSFLMGSRETRDELSRAYDFEPQEGQIIDERPRRRVRISRSFYLGAHEVTVGQFRRFVRATGYQTDAERQGTGSSFFIDADGNFERSRGLNWQKPGMRQNDDHPVVHVSWNDAVEFCRWLSRQERATYRLPTEAEWEYACRAGTQTRHYAGNDPESLTQIGNMRDGSLKAKFPKWDYTLSSRDGYVYTAPVGKFRSNEFGVYDMLGNVWEWCSDWYDKDYYRGGPLVDPPGPRSGRYHVTRGGCFY